MPSASSTGPLQAVDYRSSPPCSHFWRRLRVFLVALVVCRGIVVLSILPPFEGWDEYQHVAYVEHMRQTGQALLLARPPWRLHYSLSL